MQAGRTSWVVDAMNVIGTRPDGWWRDRHGAIARLVAQLEAFARAQDATVCVVLEHAPSPPITSDVVEVAHAPRGGRDAADDEIARRVSADADPASLRVATSDRRLAERVRAVGAAVEPAAAFRARLDAAGP
jgi:predicted RNA-binding protein with PIN domain